MLAIIIIVYALTERILLVHMVPQESANPFWPNSPGAEKNSPWKGETQGNLPEQAMFALCFYQHYDMIIVTKIERVIMEGN